VSAAAHRMRGLEYKTDAAAADADADTTVTKATFTASDINLP